MTPAHAALIEEVRDGELIPRLREYARNNRVVTFVNAAEVLDLAADTLLALCDALEGKG